MVLDLDTYRVTIIKVLEIEVSGPANSYNYSFRKAIILIFTFYQLLRLSLGAILFYIGTLRFLKTYPPSYNRILFMDGPSMETLFFQEVKLYKYACKRH